MIYAQVKIKPCLYGIPYDSEKNIDQLPTTPILNILQFTFSPGVDLSEASQPASALWRASLEFISTIPGFQGLHLGFVDQTSPSQQVLVLYQWGSGLAWRRFQCSIGFRMLLGYVREVYNRCVQLSLPAQISSSTFSCILELVSFQFSYKLARRDPSLKDFSLRWESTLFPLLSNQTELLSASGDWLQIDDRTENRYFAGLLFWKADMDADSPQRLIRDNLHNIADNIKKLSSDTIAVVSLLTQKLQFESPESLRPKGPVRLPVSKQSNYRHPLLNLYL